MVAADLINAEGDGFLFISVFAFDHQHRDAIDQEYNVFTGAVVAIVKGPLFGDFIDVFAGFRRPLGIVVVDQDQIALALFVVVKELAVIA